MNVVIKVNDEIKKKMIEYYKDKVRDKKIPYVVFQAQEEDTVITMYESGKVMFQGVSADVDAAMWGTALENTKEKQAERKKENAKYYNCSAVGSDEVGTGDYFGPIVVTATFVSKEDIPFLEKLGVGDSKKIDDSKILKIAPEIAKKIKYKSVILSNREYNENYTKDINMNKIKAILHNRVLYQLVNEVRPKYDYIIVDEFAREARYYDYIKDQKVIQRDITFMTKAEDKNMAVACGSIISRYIFLKEFDKLCDSIHIPLPKGAGKDVDSIGEEVVEKYGEEKLKDIAKLNFKNTERILHTMIY
ncbi:MAG: ribonuclease HIII [Mollicutes bacterium]|nr:ribonuclease HIII [Mollicutes bacterium]MDY5875647.1 ribonuclease HIII [Bacilli bacterium]